MRKRSWFLRFRFIFSLILIISNLSSDNLLLLFISLISSKRAKIFSWFNFRLVLNINSLSFDYLLLIFLILISFNITKIFSRFIFSFILKFISLCFDYLLLFFNILIYLIIELNIYWLRSQFIAHKLTFVVWFSNHQFLI